MRIYPQTEQSQLSCDILYDDSSVAKFRKSNEKCFYCVVIFGFFLLFFLFFLENRVRAERIRIILKVCNCEKAPEI